VLDGHLTFATRLNPKNNKKGCDGISWIKISKKKTESNKLPTPTWVKDAIRKNPWWQMELSKKTAVGAVTIQPMAKDPHDCSSRWLFKGTSCAGKCILGDFLDEVNEGAIVGVSDEPCKGEKECPGTVCGRITRAPITCSGSLDCALANSQLQTTIDCKGAEGKYVWVQLPGKRRILAGLDIKVNRYMPETTAAGNPVGPETLLCYGVRARVPTETDPEFVTTNDPEDPIFYSTCYVREKEVRWLRHIEPEADTRWRFNGRCVDCDCVTENSALTRTTPPVWRLADEEQCRDCDAAGELCAPSS